MNLFGKKAQAQKEEKISMQPTTPATNNKNENNTPVNSVASFLSSVNEHRAVTCRETMQAEALAYYYAVMSRLMYAVAHFATRQFYRAELSTDGLLFLQNENGSHIREECAPIPENLALAVCKVLTSQGWEMKSDSKGYAVKYVLKIPQSAP